MTIIAWLILLFLGAPIAAAASWLIFREFADWVRDEGWADLLGCLLPVVVFFAVASALGWAVAVVIS